MRTQRAAESNHAAKGRKSVWRGSWSARPSNGQMRGHSQRLPKSNHNHLRFGRAATCKVSSNSSLPPRAISAMAACLSTLVQTMPQLRQRNAGCFSSTFGPKVPQKPRCCGGNSKRQGPSKALTLPSVTRSRLQLGHLSSISAGGVLNGDRRRAAPPILHLDSTLRRWRLRVQFGS
jgi:hypothetical protein